MFRRLFTDHPKSVEESYAEHFAVASGFGMTMIWGGIKAVVHGFIPGLCTTAGSDTVRRLHERLVAQRAAKGEAVEQKRTVEWII